jgi:CspA family cold shock protein
MTDIVLKTDVVKFYSPTDGYGFIVDDETGSDVFVHENSVKASDLNELYKGEEISFRYKKKGDKFYASQIKPL